MLGGGHGQDTIGPIVYLIDGQIYFASCLSELFGQIIQNLTITKEKRAGYD